MIYGIGTDMVSVKRIETLYKKYGAAFAERILHPAELDELASAARPAHFLAKRFAAKEAFAKAVGTGIRGEVGLRRIGVGHNRLGKPEYICEAPLQQWLRQQGIACVHLSLSDEEGHVLAFALAERAA
ncbi:MAG: holo-ACP synthase [Neisseria sp.]|nr:holo-ACP synthase [Neisseria sp.]